MKSTAFVRVHGAWHRGWCWRRICGKPGWPFVALKTGHDAMVSAPADTARLLLEFA